MVSLRTGSSLLVLYYKDAPYRYGAIPSLYILSTGTLSKNIRQDLSGEGIKLLGNEVTLSQCEGDTNLFCADLTAIKNVLKTVGDF